MGASACTGEGPPIELTTVTRHIRRLVVPSAAMPSGVGTNVYLIGDAAEAIMVDAGYADAAALAAARELLAAEGPLWVKLLVLTHHHRDHVHLAGEMAAHLGCPLAAHQQAAGRLTDLGPIKPLCEGDRLRVAGLEIAVLDAPGHTGGHLHLHLPADRAMLVGDNLAGQGTVSIIPPEGSLTQYLASLRRLLTYDLSVLAPGHGPPLTRPGEAVQAVIEHRLMREDQILGLLKAAPLSPASLATAIYAGAVPPEVMRMAEQTVQAHLCKLEHEGRVRQDNGLYALT